MTDRQWEMLRAVVDGERLDKPLCGFIADSPWLPGWNGTATILDYFASERTWLETNLAAVRAFPDALFLPGFWSEYGMCTEPSAFGARLVWHENELPFAEALFPEGEQAPVLARPEAGSAGLLPFTLRRLVAARPAIEAEGHAIRFAVARGPLNIASFLMGTTGFLTVLKTDPEGAHRMLEVITAFLEEWLQRQAAAIPTIRGVMILDDIVGFIGKEDVAAFAIPYLRRAFAAIPGDVRLFHNDANGLSCASQLAGAGVNLFNFGFAHPIAEMRELVGPKVALLGNIPPRDVLAAGSPDDVRRGVAAQKEALGGDYTRTVFSCGGGLPPGVSSANLRAFLDEAGA